MACFRRITIAGLFASTTSWSERKTSEGRAILFLMHTDGTAKQIHKLIVI